MELEAVSLELQRRARDLRELNRKYLHLVDSQVVLALMSKRRSSSRALNFSLMRINAVALATGIRPIMAYIRSHDNPAGWPSRGPERFIHGR